MKKILYILIILLLISICVQGEEKLSRIFIPDFKLIELTNIPDQYKKDFSRSKPLHNELTEKAIETVDNFGKFEIISAEELDEIYEELNITKGSPDIDERTFIKIGKLANADYLLLGSLAKGTFSATINLNLEPVNFKKKPAETATKLLGASFITYKKYWQIKQNDLDNGLKQLNLKNTSTIDINSAVELGKITKSRLVIQGEIKQPDEKITVSIRVLEVESGDIIYENKIETTSKNEIP